MTANKIAVWVALAVLNAMTPVHALQINIVAGGGMHGAAVAAFSRAAAQWEARIADPITVTVSVNLLNLGANNILGQASASLLIGGYDLIRDAMVLDAGFEPDDGVVAALPTAAAFSATLPPSVALGGGIIATKANLKALGFAGLDASFGVLDGNIEFNSNFTFDFDSSDGISGTDFETVAAHELGHTLGFISMVDFVDQIIGGVSINPGEISPTTLDLFRFGAAPGLNPDDAAAFTALARELRADEEVVFDDSVIEFAMSTGAFTGDGRQASHFKDDALTGIHIGIMDPTLAAGVAFAVGEADLRTLDLIGYDIMPIPLPPALLLLFTGLLTLAGIGRSPGARR